MRTGGRAAAEEVKEGSREREIYRRRIRVYEAERVREEEGEKGLKTARDGGKQCKE